VAPHKSNRNAASIQIAKKAFIATKLPKLVGAWPANPIPIVPMAKSVSMAVAKSLTQTVD
jgi:hypothetical protein